MKNISFLFIGIFFSLTINAQHLAPNGGGSFSIPIQDQCLSEQERNSIKTQLAKNVATLKQQGLLSNTQKNGNTGFEWPLKKGPNFSFNNYSGVGNFVDHDPNATGTSHGNSNLDYNCGNRSYDNTNGYNHKGIDYSLWPFGWYMYDNDFVEVVAAKSGTIIGHYDGNYDKNCSCTGNWNAVYLQHADGTVTWYGHLKTNSLTTKTLGETVSQGEYLGIVASSGCSTWPHLHFEVYDNGNLVDPYAGPCNSMNTNSYWTNQPNYRVPTVNALMTHDAVPVHSCQKADEQPHMNTVFSRGQRAYFAAYYTDQMSGAITNYRIRQPNNSIWQSWTHTSPNTYTNSWWYWWWDLPTNAAAGEWKLEADFNGETFVHHFYVHTTTVNVDVQVNLEGAFDLNSQNMLNEIQSLGLLPEGSNPYNTTPWNHTGFEGTGWRLEDYPPNAVDWVLLSFRTTTQASTEFAKRAAILKTDGTLSSFSPIQVNIGVQTIYIVVEHRNHLPVMSNSISISNNTISHDFRQSAGYLGSSGFGQKELITGIWGLYSCNADQSNPTGYEITGSDRILWEVENGLYNLYRTVDFNLDGDINGEDKVLWNQNNGISSSVPRN